MDIFDIGVLNRVVDGIVPNFGFLTAKFFQRVQEETGGDIHFDVRKRGRRIAPFVHPTVQGQIVEKTGFKAHTLSPAYIKDKRVFDANSPFKRTAGERIGGSMTPAQRMEAQVAIEIADQIDMLNRRLEVMAGEILATGKVTIVGELYPEVVVDFGRDADLTVALTGADEWGQTGVDPIEDLDTWAEIIFQKSGRRPREWTMTMDAWKLFKASTSVVKILDRMRATNSVDLPDAVRADQLDGYTVGNIAGHTIHLYSGDYIDPMDNTSKNILPNFTVTTASSEAEGTQAFGAIRDEKAGWQARRYFSKSWLVEDPAVRYIMLQSAPILYPTVPDATFAATVKEESA